MTYVPPFIHQEASQCTMTAALMAANVAHVGRLDPTQAAVRELAAASGLAKIPPKGYTTRHMMKALAVQFGLNVNHVGYSPETWRARLASGWAGLIAVEYPRLPAKLRLDPDFTGGHRLLVIGYDGATDETYVVDPILREGDFRLEPVPVPRIHRAQGHFADWQVWVREGQALPPSIVPTRVFDEPITVNLTKGKTYTFFHKRLPGRKQERIAGPESQVEVDRRGRRVDSGGGAADEPLYRVVDGSFPALRGWWIRAGDGLVVEEPGIVAAVPGEVDTTYLEGYAAGIAEERARWEEWSQEGPATDGPTLLAGHPDDGVGEGLAND